MFDSLYSLPTSRNTNDEPALIHESKHDSPKIKRHFVTRNRSERTSKQSWWIIRFSTRKLRPYQRVPASLIDFRHAGRREPDLLLHASITFPWLSWEKLRSPGRSWFNYGCPGWALKQTFPPFETLGPRENFGRLASSRNLVSRSRYSRTR